MGVGLEFRGRWMGMLVAALFVSACATSPERINDPRDPLEPMNRVIYRFNSYVDKALIKPLAQGYRAITPDPVERGISNVFYNIDDVTSAVNNVLQFKMSRAGSDIGRIFINSTVGVLGFFDVATNVGLPSYKEDFGQTLGYWGLESGAYVVLPFLGPSTMRDNLGWVGDVVTDPLINIREDRIYWGLIGMRLVNQRAKYLATGEILEDSALDTYAFLRDAYLQRRESQVHDGNPPTATAPQADFWDDVDFDTKTNSRQDPAN